MESDSIGAGRARGQATEGGREQRSELPECELLKCELPDWELLKDVPPSDQRLLNNPIEQWLHFSVRPKRW